MIDYLKGKLIAVSPGKVILEVGGVGLHIETPVSAGELERLIGQEVALYTRLVLKENEACLYGFRGAEERNLFNLVLGISGIGPRLALSLLSVFAAPEFYVAVLEEDITMLCRTPGIGRKVAQRLVLELKEKLPRLISLEEIELTVALPVGASPRAEIIEALCALGYSRAEASAAVNRVAGRQEGLSREDLLKLALKSISG